MIDESKQALDTISNLIYLFVAAIVVGIATNAAAAVFVVTMIYVFLGSWLYHAIGVYEDKPWQHWSTDLDVSAIYVMLTTLALLAVTLPAIPSLLLGVGTGLTLRYAEELRLRQYDLEIKTGALAAIVIAALLVRHLWVWCIVGTVILGVGYALRQRAPERWAHAAWHVLAGIGVGVWALGAVL